MSIRFACTGCGSQLKVADEKAGSSGKCPKCGAAIVVPTTARATPTRDAAVSPVTEAPIPFFAQPVEELPAFPAINTEVPPYNQPPIHTSPPAAAGDYRPAKTLTTVTAALLGTLLVLDVAMWVVGILDFVRLQDIAPYLPVDDMPAAATDLARLGVLAVYIPIYVTCVVSFCMWTYRANRNAAALAGRPLTHSPAWSVGYYFVPVVNLFRPYQAMKEIWGASGVRRVSTNLLTVWWTLWIVAEFGNRLLNRLNFKAETAGDLRGCTFLEIALGFVNVPLCITAILVVRRLYAMQQEKAGLT